jgi:lipopolysaccharide transport system ATP-binding protein
MSSDQVAISVRGLSKSYRIAHKQKHSTMAEAMLHRLSTFGGKPPEDMLWALQDVSFDIPKGDIVGIIGRNGAGKSTLFKVLSRIVEPSAGEARMMGRVGSLIEVGTGFQPELTGRENIFLNGAILGMRRREISRRFDEIVDFSGVERFLDTQVKNYSSGMYVRLAFAVAAHLDTDILLVDEVLSVGDAEFQKKSLGKMGDVANSGRTVLLVSHNVATLEALCKRGLLMSQGQLLKAGPIGEVVADYHRLLQAGMGTNAVRLVDYGGKHKYFRQADLLDEFGESSRNVPMGAAITVRAVVETPDAIEYPTIRVYIDRISGENVLALKSPKTGNAIPRLAGLSEINCRIDSLLIPPGDYAINLWLTKGEQELEKIASEIRFTVRNSDAFNDGRGYSGGLCVCRADWSVAQPALEAPRLHALGTG